MHCDAENAGIQSAENKDVAECLENFFIMFSPVMVAEQGAAAGSYAL